MLLAKYFCKSPTLVVGKVHLNYLKAALQKLFDAKTGNAELNKQTREWAECALSELAKLDFSSAEDIAKDVRKHNKVLGDKLLANIKRLA